MKLIKPKFEILEQSADLEGIYKMIELAGRTCYKSEDRITEDSAKKFADMMIKSGHGAMLEHGTVYLKITVGTKEVMDDALGNNPILQLIERYVKNKYSKVIFDKYYENVFRYEEAVKNVYITTNLRVLVENNWLDDLQYLCEPTKYHEKRYTVRFVCDRGVSHEFVRHRVMSFAQESTRYCNYSKNKFNNEITFILPSWDYVKSANYNGKDNFVGDIFEHSLRDAEQYYFSLLKQGWSPQQARQVLPNALKTELIMTGFASDWKHFFDLRDAVHAHPDARALAEPLHKEFIKRKYI